MKGLFVWLADSLERVYPQTSPSKTARLAVDAARGERISVLVCMRLAGDMPARIEVTARPPDGIDCRIRRIGYVPVRHINTQTPRQEREGADFLPGLCPDVLYEESQTLLAPEETTSFWVTVSILRNCRAGVRQIPVIVRPEGQKEIRLNAVVNVSSVVLQPRRDFPVTHWFYADAILDWYKLQPWEEKFWTILQAYLRNLVEHGQDTIYVPVFTPPLDGVKRPSQLLRVRKAGTDRYIFDWRNVRRWIRLAEKAGIKNFEWCHWFTQWGVKHALRIYDGPNGDGRLLWKPTTGATSPIYRKFLAQFLPELKRFLKAEGIMNRSFFHLSDEPHGDEHIKNYRKARTLLRQLAPWMPVMDALSDIRFGREKLTDMPVPSITTVLNFKREGIRSWCYFCCGPRGRYLNRLMDTPLAKIRMSGWLFHRFGIKGFLHWGYNYWQKSQSRELIDPFTEQSGGAWPNWAFGDTFVVYPGPDGPLDSIRWEIWAESLQDMALLQTAGVSAESAMLKELRSFEEFPKTAAWLRRIRKQILRR